MNRTIAAVLGTLLTRFFQSSTSFSISTPAVSTNRIIKTRNPFGVVTSIRSPPLFSEPDDNGEDHGKISDVANLIAQSVSSLRGKTVVVKYGGNAMTSESLATQFCQDVATLQNLGIRMVVVHGGGPQISRMLERVGVESKFSSGGLRISSADVVEVAEMVLCGSVNKKIASGIGVAGGRAVGLSGRDDGLLQCTRDYGADGEDIGFVGNVETVNTVFLEQLLSNGITPVISPIGSGIIGKPDEEQTIYNINADVAAGRIAGELEAERVLFLTDIAGVLDKEMKLLRKLSVADVNNLIKDETITGGMIPKVSYATDALRLGVRGAFITDGRVPHALLNEILMGGKGGEGGTFIMNE